MNDFILAAKLRRLQTCVAEMNVLADEINIQVAQIRGDQVAKNPAVACIQQVVADAYGISLFLLTSKVRTRPAPEARHMAIYLSERLLKLSFSEVTRSFGLTHSMAEYARDETKAHAEVDRDFARKLADITKVAEARIREMKANGRTAA